MSDKVFADGQKRRMWLDLHFRPFRETLEFGTVRENRRKITLDNKAG